MNLRFRGHFKSLMTNHKPVTFDHVKIVLNQHHTSEEWKQIQEVTES